MQFKYVITNETNPYRNLATEQELMRHTVAGMAILFLWQNDNTIVVGRNQDVASECKTEAFLGDGGLIARRRSGGGAVYHDMGNLNFSILCKAAEQELCMYQRIVIDMLRDFHIETEYNGRNDLIIDGKKFSGNAIYQDGDTVCQHGTLLISTDISRMVSFLTPDQDKLDRNFVKSVESRVTNLCEINEEIKINSIKRAFIRATDASEFNYVPAQNLLSQLTEFYKSNTWIYGGKR